MKEQLQRYTEEDKGPSPLRFTKSAQAMEDAILSALQPGWGENKNPKAYAPLGYLMERSRLPRNTALRAIKRLEDLGRLKVYRRNGVESVYEPLIDVAEDHISSMAWVTPKTGSRDFVMPSRVRADLSRFRRGIAPMIVSPAHTPDKPCEVASVDYKAIGWDKPGHPTSGRPCSADDVYVAPQISIPPALTFENMPEAMRAAGPGERTGAGFDWKAHYEARKAKAEQRAAGQKRFAPGPAIVES